MDIVETDHLISLVPSADSSHDSVPQCRICLSTEDSDDLIQPCLCSGSAAFIHRCCLDDWRATNIGKKAFSECGTCFFRYTIEASRTAEASEKARARKLRLRVIRDVMIGIVCITAGLCIVALLIQHIDQSVGSPLRHIWPQSINHLYVYWLCAFLVALAFIGLFGLIAQCLGLQDRILGRVPETESESFFLSRLFIDPYFCRYHGGHHSGDGGGDAGEAMMVICIVIVIVLAVFGIVYGAIYGTWLIEKMSSRSIKRRWYRAECDNQPVKDWSSDRDGMRQLARKAK